MGTVPSTKAFFLFSRIIICIEGADGGHKIIGRMEIVL